jgi:hypothetical protein
MIEVLQRQLDEALLISLDHDLEPQEPDNPECPDPGDGRMVADYLAQRDAVCPVIIHTTNAPAAVGMQRVLDEAGWNTQRVTPFFNMQWIPKLWLPVVRDAIVASASADDHSVPLRTPR